MDKNSKPVSENNRNKDREMIQLTEELRRFAYQNGMAADKINSFFKHVQDRDDQQGGSVNRELRLYRAAAAELSRDPAVHNDGSAIGFQEDRESHLALQSLPLNERMAAVLYLVNGYASSFTAQVLQLDERKLMELIDNAKQKIAERLSIEDPQELTQRMQFLEKSIKRIKLPENEAPIDESPAADELPQEPIPKVKKPAIWLVVASIALLAGVVGSSFFFDSFRLPTASEASEGQLTQEMADEMEQQYAETRENAKQNLDMEEGQFAEFAYVAGADEEKDKLFSRGSLQQHKDDAELFTQQTKELVWMIETPKGMGESLANSGHMPIDEMDRFMQLYFEKTTELQAFAEDILKNNEDQLPETSEHYGEPQLLIEEIPDASPELEQLLAAWEEYGLRFRLVDPDRMHLLVKNMDQLQQLPQFQTHPFAGMYLPLFMFHPYFDEQGWLVEPNHFIGAFDAMLYLLIDEPTESKLKTEIEVMYEQMFWQITKGAEHEIYEGGVVKPEIRNLWKSLSSYDPLAAILLPVIDEMENSGWQQSDSLDNLEYGDSLEMLKLERQGELSSTLPNGDFPVESELVDLADFDYGRVKELYARFKQSYDTKLLAGVQPMDIYLLYFYANHQKDSETMYHLFADSELKPSLERYMADWTAVPELTENALWVEIQQEMTQRIYKKVMIQPAVAYEEQDIKFHRANPLQPALLTEQDHIWLVQYEQQEFSQGPDPELQEQGMKAYEMLASQEKLPENTSPLIVTYALLHAIDEENFVVANSLLSDEAEEQEVEFWRDFASSHQVAGFQNLESMSFTASDLNIQNDIEASLEILYETNQTEQWYEHLQMALTPEGWRFELYPGY
ncbi:hypothetical protein PO902_02825 [Planococcus maritimus]|nr:hypothetical protein [Planococcus sp. SK3692]MDE4083995.1 hypothetical protein [Planococcus maritimus]